VLRHHTQQHQPGTNNPDKLAIRRITASGMFGLGAQLITIIATRMTSCAQASAPPMVNWVLIWLSHTDPPPWLDDFRNQESTQIKAGTHYKYFQEWRTLQLPGAPGSVLPIVQIPRTQRRCGTSRRPRRIGETNTL